MAEREYDFDGTFFQGAKSDCDPGQVPLGYYWLGINTLNLGGLLGCRPGYRCIVQLPPGRLQGHTIFRPKVGIEQAVVVVDGNVFVADWPFKNFRQLPNVKFSAHARQIFWGHTDQSVRRLADDIGSAIEVIVPKSVLIMQDGGATAPAWYDGSDSGHDRGKEFGIPAGGAMKWVGDRLWVAKGNAVYASDIGNPFSFREQIYLGGQSAFTFSGDVTALASTPSIEFPQLLVFTEEVTTLVKANIRERDQWLTTPDMARDVFQVGTTSQRSVVSHFGQLAWFSRSGLVTFDSAALSKQAARLPTRDNEMMASKVTLSDDLSTVAGAAFGQFILMSVPAEGRLNKHTWVLNNGSLATVKDDSGPSYAGHWIGTQPVEWSYGVVAGADRIFHVSTDEDGNNRLWEAFRPERLDNGCPITWAAFTRGYFGMTSTSRKTPGRNTQFCYADVALAGIEEDLDIAVFYAGGLRGAFKQILAKRIKVARGNLNPAVPVTGESELFAFKPQSRTIRTVEVRQTDSETGSCPPESDRLEHVDESFQLLIVGNGPGTIRWIRAHSQMEPEEQSGDPDACKDETAENAVRFDGFGASDETWEGAAAALASVGMPVFTATKTASLEVSGFSAVAAGSSESIISQKAADRSAERIAVRLAETEIMRAMPPVISVGSLA